MIKNILFKFRYNNFIKSKIGTVKIIVILMVVVIIFLPHFCRYTYKVTITNKQIIKHNNVDRYLIYTQTEDGSIMVFEDKNNLLELKFNSGDLYLAMEINREYEVRAYGLNIPLLSDYPNIIKVKGLKYQNYIIGS